MNVSEIARIIDDCVTDIVQANDLCKPAALRVRKNVEAAIEKATEQNEERWIVAAEEIEKARADTKRLDWLDSVRKDEETWCYVGVALDSIREAIDEVMKSDAKHDADMKKVIDVAMKEGK